MLPHRNPLLASAKFVVAVTVEYTAHGQRRTKTFTGPRAVTQSRAFYRSKLMAGAEPKIVSANRAHP